MEFVLEADRFMQNIVVQNNWFFCPPVLYMHGWDFHDIIGNEDFHHQKYASTNFNNQPWCTVKHHSPDYIVEYGNCYPPMVSCVLYYEETV